jgi:thioesterase domain-containing protein
VDLAKKLEDKFSVVGVIQDDYSFSSLKKMAEAYAKEILLVNNSDRYSLLGWSLGGLVAIEVAKILRRRFGKDVQLVLIDPAYPLNKKYGELISEDFIKAFVDNLVFSGLKLERVIAIKKLKMKFLGKNMRQFKNREHFLGAEGLSDDVDSLFIKYATNYALIASYKVSKYSGDVGLILPGDKFFERKCASWKKVIFGDMRCKKIGKNHFSALYENVNDVKDFLEKFISG